MPRRYVIVSPVRDEAAHARRTLESVIQQTLPPALWLIVDDGSSDATPCLLREYAGRVPYIQVVNKPNRGARKVGAGVIEAFDFGLRHVDLRAFDYICKLDLDLDLPHGYFEALIERMERDPRIGTCSGKAYFPASDNRLGTFDGMLITEGIGDEQSVGASKLYRVSCFEQIGGFVPNVMWDGIDCHTARMKGWIARSWDEPALRFIHLRPMGSSENGIIAGRVRHGRGQYFMGTNPVYMLASATFRTLFKPYVVGGAAMMWGYVRSALRGEKRYENPEFRRYLRRYHWTSLVLGKRRATRWFEARCLANWRPDGNGASRAPGPPPAATDPRSAPFRAERWWVKPLLSLATMLMMLPLMEIAVRVVAPQPASWLAIYRRHPALPTYSYQSNASATLDTGESRWTVHTDENGFRVGGQPAPPDDRPIALWLGDSFTFGYGVDYEDSFVGRLARDPQRRYRHVNAAVGGHGPIQYRQMLEYLLDQGVRPQVVLLATFLGNDFLDCVESKDIPVRDGILGNEGGLKSLLKQRFHLYRLATRAVHQLPAGRLGLDGGGPPTARSPDEAEMIYRREFERLAALCRAHGIEMAVLVIPWPVTADAAEPPGTPSPRRDESRERGYALSTFRDLGIRYLDLTSFLAPYPAREVCFYYDRHFTPRGHRLVAEALRREWSKLL
jgi:glycosyltransferase involved in cell wall biosynthesis